MIFKSHTNVLLWNTLGQVSTVSITLSTTVVHAETIMAHYILLKALGFNPIQIQKVHIPQN